VIKYPDLSIDLSHRSKHSITSIRMPVCDVLLLIHKLAFLKIKPYQ